MLVLPKDWDHSPAECNRNVVGSGSARWRAIQVADLGEGEVPLSFLDTVFRLVAAVADVMELRDNRLPIDRIARRFVGDAMETLRGNTPLLSRLSRRYRLGIVSNFYGNLATVCEEAGIRRLFGVVIDSGRVGYVKPDSRIFHRAVEELGLTPADATFVGDSLSRDMAGARAAGGGVPPARRARRPHPRPRRPPRPRGWPLPEAGGGAAAEGGGPPGRG